MWTFAFKKAFDMIDRKLLIQKLIEFDFSNNAVKLIKNNFSDRKQLVKIAAVKSDYSYKPRSFSGFSFGSTAISNLNQ